MAKASLLFPCLIVIILIAFGTGFANACNFPCHSPNGCGNLHCPGCVKQCVNFCCLCDCSPPPNGNVS
ncbi:hypothetical protein GLYMA_18G063900v4 [Glycine max]|nr:hypothetical protein GLYMA_18G063900v4 [Glycine max]KAH1153479.1 hypothetical protein GYH30_049216 [Glycine max]KAH1197036.1 hypothetical protein GmHk_18G050924 [Glycine max]